MKNKMMKKMNKTRNRTMNKAKEKSHMLVEMAEDLIDVVENTKNFKKLKGKK